MRVWVGGTEISDSVHEFWVCYSELVYDGTTPYMYLHRGPSHTGERLEGVNAAWYPTARLLDEHFPDGWHVWMEEDYTRKYNDPRSVRARLETKKENIRVTAYGYPPVEAFRGIANALDLAVSDDQGVDTDW